MGALRVQPNLSGFLRGIPIRPLPDHIREALNGVSTVETIMPRPHVNEGELDGVIQIFCLNDHDSVIHALAIRVPTRNHTPSGT